MAIYGWNQWNKVSNEERVVRIKKWKKRYLISLELIISKTYQKKPWGNNFESFLFLVEHQILINFWSILGPKMKPKMVKNRPETRGSQGREARKTVNRSFSVFFLNFGWGIACVHVFLDIYLWKQHRMTSLPRWGHSKTPCSSREWRRLSQAIR